MKIVFKFKFIILMIGFVLALNTALAQEPTIITHETVNMAFEMMYFK